MDCLYLQLFFFVLIYFHSLFNQPTARVIRGTCLAIYLMCLCNNQGLVCPYIILKNEYVIINCHIWSIVTCAILPRREGQSKFVPMLNITTKCKSAQSKPSCAHQHFCHGQIVKLSHDAMLLKMLCYYVEYGDKARGLTCEDLGKSNEVTVLFCLGLFIIINRIIIIIW